MSTSLLTSERYTAAALRGIYVCGKCGVLVANDDRHDEWHDDNRHAKLAALVSELTVAVEALERKVESLVRLELEDSGLIPTPSAERIEHAYIDFLKSTSKGNR